MDTIEISDLWKKKQMSVFREECLGVSCWSDTCVPAPSGGAHAVARPPDGRGHQRPVRARQEEHPAGAHRLHVGPHRDATRARHRVRPGARRGGECGECGVTRK